MMWGLFILMVALLEEREGGTPWPEPLKPQYVGAIRGTGAVIGCPLRWPTGFK